MTYDDRDAKAAGEMNPNVHPSDRPAKGMGVGMWFTILAVLAVASFFFFNNNREGSVATNDRPAATVPSTTGSGASTLEPAARDGLPNSTHIPGAASPTVPAPPRE